MSELPTYDETIDKAEKGVEEPTPSSFVMHGRVRQVPDWAKRWPKKRCPGCKTGCKIGCMGLGYFGLVLFAIALSCSGIVLLTIGGLKLTPSSYLYDEDPTAAIIMLVFGSLLFCICCCCCTGAQQ